MYGFLSVRPSRPIAAPKRAGRRLVGKSVRHSDRWRQAARDQHDAPLFLIPGKGPLAELPLLTKGVRRM